MAIQEPTRPGPARARRPQFEEEEFDWRVLLMAARERLWMILVLPILGGALGFAYIKKTQPVFQARATLEVEDKQQVMKIEEVANGELHDAATMNTVAATIQSRTFLEKIAERERFHEKPGFFGATEPSSDRAGSQEEAVDVLAGALSAVVRPNTRLIDITAEHVNPELARAMAQAAAEGIIRFGLEQRARAASLANDFLVQEASRLKAALEKSEMELQEYRDNHNAVSLEKDQNVVVAELTNLSVKLSAATTERVQMETDFQALKEAGADMDRALQLKSVSTHRTISALTQAIAEKKSEFAVLKNRYGPKHPKYITLQTELTNLEEQLRTSLPEVVAQFQSSVANAVTNEAKAAEALAAQEKKALALDRLAVQYNVRKRDVDSNNTMYESVLARLKEVDITKGMENNNLKIQEAASADGEPVWPTPAKVYSAAVGGGLTVAFGLAFLLHFMDRSIKTVDQAEKQLSLPVLGAITLGRKNGDSALDAVKEPHGPVAEAFRSLRVMASLLGKEDDRRTFLITSAVPSEGKTFCASNYAVSLAQQGLRTLLIDADLRKPRVSSLFYGENRKPGLTEYLLGKISLEEAGHPTIVGGLTILPAGERAPNPAEILAGGGMKQLFAEALLHYDRVVVDSAPVVAVSDTLMIAPLVDTVLQVIQWSKTPAPVAQRAIGLLRDAGKAPAGLVLNQLPVKARSYYYYYSPGYYGSQGVYGAKA